MTEHLFNKLTNRVGMRKSILALLFLTPFLIGQDSVPIFKSTITGGDEVHIADVKLQAGVKRLQTSASVTVEETSGAFVFAQQFFTVITTGAIGSTIRVQITDDSIDVTTTVTASEVGDPIAFAQLIVDTLNADTNFDAVYSALKGALDSRVFITAIVPGPSGERLDANDLQVTFTGSTGLLNADVIEQGKKILGLVPHPLDRNLGTINISGTINILPAEISKRYFELFKNAGSSDMLVDGSTTPIVFTVPLNINDEIFVEQIRCFGGGNGIKFGQFLSKNSLLTNGVTIEIQSLGDVINLEPIKSTEDWKNLFASDVPQFRVEIQSGKDQFIAILKPPLPFPLAPVGDFVPDDHITITINDDLTSGISQLECGAVGFRQTM